MSRVAQQWYSPHLGRDVNVVRWGEIGVPVLFFPTASGDAEEVERFLMVDALAPLLEAGRIKLYSVDSVAGQVWLNEDNHPPHATWVLDAYDAFLTEELLPAIRTDCRSDKIEVVATGASVGAYNALAAICRHPDAFSHAICLSGTYELSKFIDGDLDDAWYHASPLHFLPDLPENDPGLASLRKRFIRIAHGTGRWESPEESWDVANCLGSRGVPNRVEEWGEQWDHDWPTWRRMLPQFLGEILPA